jgi:hypothetical protein
MFMAIYRTNQVLDLASASPVTAASAGKAVKVVGDSHAASCRGRWLVAGITL